MPIRLDAGHDKGLARAGAVVQPPFTRRAWVNGNYSEFSAAAPYVIHARATNFINDDHSERYLDLAVAQSLRVAREAGFNSIVMYAFGTGVFKFPKEMAVEIILKGGIPPNL